MGLAKKMFENCSQLEFLQFEGDLSVFKDVVVKQFPKLNALQICVDKDETNAFCTLLQLNPQLKHLSGIWQSNGAITSAIVMHLVDLKELHLTSHSPRGYYMYGNIQWSNKIHQSELLNLTDEKPRITPLLEALADSNIRLESLELYYFDIKQNDLTILSNWNTINTLGLKGFYGVMGSDLIPLGTQILFLKRIEIESDDFLVDEDDEDSVNF